MGPQSGSGRFEKKKKKESLLVVPGFDDRTLQSVASCCTGNGYCCRQTLMRYTNCGTGTYVFIHDDRPFFGEQFHVVQISLTRTKCGWWIVDE